MWQGYWLDEREINKLPSLWLKKQNKEIKGETFSTLSPAGLHVEPPVLRETPTSELALGCLISWLTSERCITLWLFLSRSPKHLARYHHHDFKTHERLFYVTVSTTGHLYANILMHCDYLNRWKYHLESDTKTVPYDYIIDILLLSFIIASALQKTLSLQLCLSTY